jgi:hypothetical protein
MSTSLYCHDCGGDRLYGTCSCCVFCPSCGGCLDCGVHEKGCLAVVFQERWARGGGVASKKLPPPDSSPVRKNLHVR